jgi:rare lipoprotein A
MMGRQSRRGSCLVVLAVLLLAGCSTSGPVEPKTPAIYRASGLASYYAQSLHGKVTASGEHYHRERLTAAHRSLPFGTRLKVTNLSNGREVVVRVNDRGPFIKGRIIDLSYAAAKALRMIRQGVVKVRLEQIP